MASILTKTSSHTSCPLLCGVALLSCICLNTACEGTVDSSFEDAADMASLARDLGSSPRDMSSLPYDQGRPPSMRDMSPSLDLSAPPQDMREDPSRDMGSQPLPDMDSPPLEDMAGDPPPVDMGGNMPPVDMGGMPPDGPPPSPSVETVLNQGCTTTVVRGLSEQLIAQMNCIQPGVVSSFAHLQNLNLYSAVFPFLQSPAVQGLTSTVAGQNTLTISSALRTIPQQYLLYRWYQQGRCNIGLAARPGRSNHNGALAIDTPDYTAWKSRFQANGWQWLGSNDPVHFNYTAGGTDIRELSVLAFQKLWNTNNPNDVLVEDGIYGSNTESRLKQSPSNGFAIPPWCPSSRQHDLEQVRRVSPPVRLVSLQSEFVEVELYTPGVTRAVRYLLGEEVEIDLERSPHSATNAQFHVALPRDLSRPLSVVAVELFDEDEALLRAVHGILPGRVNISLLPEGGGIYRLQHHDPPRDAFSMELHVMGELVELDPMSVHDASPFDLLLSTRGMLRALAAHDTMLARSVPLTIVLRDASGEILERHVTALTLQL